jgi:hypothetical protein
MSVRGKTALAKSFEKQSNKPAKFGFGQMIDAGGALASATAVELAA